MDDVCGAEQRRGRAKRVQPDRELDVVRGAIARGNIAKTHLSTVDQLQGRHSSVIGYKLAVTSFL